MGGWEQYACGSRRCFISILQHPSLQSGWAGQLDRHEGSEHEQALSQSAAGAWLLGAMVAG